MKLNDLKFNITQQTPYAYPFPRIFHIVSPLSKNDSFRFVCPNTKLNVGIKEQNLKATTLTFTVANQIIHL